MYCSKNFVDRLFFNSLKKKFRNSEKHLIVKKVHLCLLKKYVSTMYHTYVLKRKNICFYFIGFQIYVDTLCKIKKKFKKKFSTTYFNSLYFFVYYFVTK